MAANRPDNIGELLDVHELQVFSAAMPGGNAFVLNFTIPYYKHIGYFLQLGFADFKMQAFIAKVNVRPYIIVNELFKDFCSKSKMAVCDRDHHGLHRREPGRESAGKMFDQNAHKPLHGAEDDAVQHDRPVLAAVFADIGQVEALGQDEVALNGGALPGALQAVVELEVDFRAVKSAIALVDLIGKSV